MVLALKLEGLIAEFRVGAIFYWVIANVYFIFLHSFGFMYLNTYVWAFLVGKCVFDSSSS